MKRTAVMAVLVSFSITQSASPQELVSNGDFEILAVSGDPPTPTRDAFGNAVPIDWFRATGEASPGPPAKPLTELIGPENADPPDDSDGDGQYSVALNPSGIDHSDWRSDAFATTPGEELFWSFDFKVNYVNPGFSVQEGFRIELRSFDNGTVGGSTSGSFVGEQTVYVYMHGYGPDGNMGGYVTGGGYPHPEASVTLANFNDGQWHTLSSDIFGDQNATDDNTLWAIPAGGTFSDIRFSINAGFIPVFSEQSQIRVDNISVVRPIEGVAGDYNNNGTVDAADYVVWRKLLGTNTQLENEGENATPGMVTTEDYDTWRANFGLMATGSGSASSAGVAAPEPSVWPMLMAAPIFLAMRRQAR